MKWMGRIFCFFTIAVCFNSNASERQSFVLTHVFFESAYRYDGEALFVYIRENKLRSLRSLNSTDVRILESRNLKESGEIDWQELELSGLRNMYRDGAMTATTGGIMINIRSPLGSLFTGNLKPSKADQASIGSMGHLDWRQVPSFPSGPQAVAAIRSGEATLRKVYLVGYSIWGNEEIILEVLKRGLPRHLETPENADFACSPIL